MLKVQCENCRRLTTKYELRMAMDLSQAFYFCKKCIDDNARRTIVQGYEKYKKLLPLIAVLVLSAAVHAIDITVIKGTDIVDYQVLNSNYAALKQAGEDCQAATNYQSGQIGALNAATNSQGESIAALNTATNYQSGQIAALNTATNNLPPPGTIVMYVTTNAPLGWLVCNGSGCHTSIYPTLHSVIGYSFGGSGTNFNLPNLKSRMPVGLDSSGSFNGLNKSGGYENVTLTIAQMPSHAHQLVYYVGGGWNVGPPNYISGYGLSIFNKENYTVNDSVRPSGGGNSHSNMPPYIVVNYIIKY